MGEAGIQDFRASNLFGLVAPKSTPAGGDREAGRRHQGRAGPAPILVSTRWMQACRTVCSAPDMFRPVHDQRGNARLAPRCAQAAKVKVD